MRDAWGILAAALALANAAGAAATLSRVVATMGSLDGVAIEHGAVAVAPEGPGGAKVARCDGRFAGRIDLKRLGIEPRDYDLLKVEVKADARAFLRLSLENYPEAGDLAHWYVLDAARGAFGWRTIWVDLRRPEEVKKAGTYKGMAAADASLRGLLFSGNVGETKRAAQGPGRSIWLGPIRFASKAVDLDWDQAKAPYTWGRGQDLVFTYPLTVRNRLDKPVAAVVRLVPFGAREAKGSLSQARVELGPKASAVVQARIALPAAVAAGAAPLTCERFEARAHAEGIGDSEVTILRSSDPIHLTVTVPIAEEKLAFPLLPRRKDLPASVTGFDERQRQAAVAAAASLAPESLDALLANQRVVFWEPLASCAFLYDATGERAHLERATAFLLRAAERFPAMQREWAAAPVAPISAGLFYVNTLRLGWVLGSMRPPYLFKCHGAFNDFDLLAADMEPGARKRIIDGLVLPAAIQMRNHYFGLTNQQDVVNYPVLYAGLAARNWPLVAFATSSEHGVRNQIRWNFDDDGLCGEGHYQSATIRPILWATELLWQVGVDLYDSRLHQILHSRAAAAIGKPYRDGIAAYVDEHRFQDKKLEKPESAPADGYHLASGTTLLRWKGLEVAMNWGAQLHRNAPDRCTLRFRAEGKHPAAFLNRAGGGNYSHSSLGQSIVIIDEGLQAPRPATVTARDLSGPVQFVQAESSAHFPGTTITRTFALIEEHVLVVDRVRSAKPRTVDWCLRYRGGGFTDPELAAALSLPMAEKAGSFTDKPGEPSRGIDYGARLKSKSHFIASTDGSWREGTTRLLMLGAPGTEVMAFAVHAAFSASKKERTTGVPMLMARRKGVAETDYVALFSAMGQSLERVPVRRADGKPADAVAVKVALQGGKVFRAVVSYEPKGTAVEADGLRTTERFATDY